MRSILRAQKALCRRDSQRSDRRFSFKLRVVGVGYRAVKLSMVSPRCPPIERSRRRRHCRANPKSLYRVFPNAITGHRYSNPSTGRWLSRDPIGEKGGLNLYCFVNNSPATRFDPDGRITFSDSCLPKAREIVLQAVMDICENIRTKDFSSCVERGRTRRMQDVR